MERTAHRIWLSLIMLSPQIKELIYQRFGYPLHTQADFIKLSNDIYKSARNPLTGEDQDTATLKPELLQKMFSDAHPPIYPGGANLNTLAQYLGYYYWDHLPGYEDVAPEINKQYLEETKDWRKRFIRNRLLFGYVPVLIAILFVIGYILWNKYFR